MSPPIQKARKCTTNILPCRIHKTGPLSTTERYWSVQEQDGGANVNKMNKVAYFRGRKLLGKEIKIEDDYRGIVARVRDDDKAQLDLTSNREQEAFRSKKRTFPGPIDLEGKTEEDGEDEIEDAKTLEEVAEFQEVVVWGHEDVPAGDDTFVRGIGEWLSFTECIHNSVNRVGSLEAKGGRSENSRDSYWTGKLYSHLKQRLRGGRHAVH